MEKSYKGICFPSFRVSLKSSDSHPQLLSSHVYLNLEGARRRSLPCCCLMLQVLENTLSFK